MLPLQACNDGILDSDNIYKSFPAGIFGVFRCILRPTQK